MEVDPDLADELELACLDALRGDPPGPAVATRLQRACLDVLRQRGIEGARVFATSTRAGTAVRVVLARRGARVTELVLELH